MAIPVPAIVDRATWEAAQRLLQANAKFSPRNNKKRQRLLTGLARCGVCGKGYFGSGAARNGRDYRYYSCTAKDPLTSPTGAACRGPHVNAECLEAAIWEAVAGIFRDPDLLKDELLQRQRRLRDNNERESRRRKLNTELKQRKEKADRFLEP